MAQARGRKKELQDNVISSKQVNTEELTNGGRGGRKRRVQILSLAEYLIGIEIHKQER